MSSMPFNFGVPGAGPTGRMPQMPSAGSNQYFPALPTMPTSIFRTPSSGYGESSFGSGSGGGSSPWGNLFSPSGSGAPGSGGSFNFDPSSTSKPWFNKGSGVASEPSQYPVVAQNWANFLKTQIGQGTGANPLLQSMLQFLTGGGSSSMPGANTLETIANQGVSALPEWQSMTAAQQQNIQQNQANLREQFAGMGDLAGSPFGTAMSNYMQQTTADQNALLGQLQMQGLLQGQLPAASGLFGAGQSMSQFGQTLLPQYNPLNSFIQSLSQTYAPMYNTKSGGGVLGGLLGNMGTLAGMGSSIAEGLGGGGGFTDVLSSLAGFFCHTAASFYGWGSEKTKRIQFWMLTQADPDIAMFYFLNSERIAKTPHRFKFKPLFDAVLGEV